MEPKLGGEELAARLSGDDPGLKILFISGYLLDGDVLGKDLASVTSFLRKPSLPDALLAKVSELVSG